MENISVVSLFFVEGEDSKWPRDGMAGEQCQKSKGYACNRGAYTRNSGAYAQPIFLQSNSPILTC